ncbi:hypothetical protein HPP92_013303 [Vanilla planifolia]|uniref:Uncharacterized protein n=1 Tax=Vanilla planifolia TaxID=51239 RepID=A0A835QXE8_VANPL|nr:hypothetical protein HPP92_013303 [Vanilla planifolia]
MPGSAGPDLNTTTRHGLACKPTRLRVGSGNLVEWRRVMRIKSFPGDAAIQRYWIVNFYESKSVKGYWRSGGSRTKNWQSTSNVKQNEIRPIDQSSAAQTIIGD